MHNHPKLLSVALLSLALFSSCKERIDINDADTCYPVQRLLDSKNADVGCDQTADFEGHALCLTGVLEVSNDPHALPLNFFLLDSADNNRAVEIRLDSSLAAEMIPLVRANRGKQAAAKGLMAGAGQPGNPDCVRSFSLTLAAAADLAIENAVPPPPRDTVNLETAVWQLTAIFTSTDTMPVPDTFPVPITAKFSAGKVEGFGGCNNFGAEYSTAGSQLIVSGVYSTKKFCQGISEWENRFFQFLGQSKTLSITGETMAIDCGENKGLLFRLNWKKRKGD